MGFEWITTDEPSPRGLADDFRRTSKENKVPFVLIVVFLLVAADASRRERTKRIATSGEYGKFAK